MGSGGFQSVIKGFGRNFWSKQPRNKHFCNFLQASLGLKAFRAPQTLVFRKLHWKDLDVINDQGLLQRRLLRVLKQKVTLLQRLAVFPFWTMEGRLHCCLNRSLNLYLPLYFPLFLCFTPPFWFSLFLLPIIIAQNLNRCCCLYLWWIRHGRSNSAAVSCWNSLQ